MFDDEGESADRDGRGRPADATDRDRAVDDSRPERPDDAVEPSEEWGRTPDDAGDRNSEIGDGRVDADDAGPMPEPNSAPVESGSPTFEHALFVALGALAMVLTVVRLVQVSVGF